MGSQARQPRIGEIYMMCFSGCDSEQSGWRPGLVLQNNVGNAHSPNIIALPLTSSLKRLGQPTHVLLPADATGLCKDSIVLCENPERMSKRKVGRFLTALSAAQMRSVAAAYVLATSAISFLDPDHLLSLRTQAVMLNGGSA